MVNLKIKLNGRDVRPGDLGRAVEKTIVDDIAKIAHKHDRRVSEQKVKDALKKALR